MDRPYLAGIFIYPVKSLDRLMVADARVLASGALEGDRQYALFDAKNQYVNAKRYPAIHRVRASFAPDRQHVSLQIQDQSHGERFDLEGDRPALKDWFSHYFGFPVHLKQNADTGFPDDPDAAGPTVISTATLETVASWFPGLTTDDVRLRMRANLEIGGVPAFWEDQLFGAVRERVRFQIGSVVLEGVNPCQRCIVPTRDAIRGDSLPQFQTTFSQQRQATLPAWANPSRFSHFYKLSVNTCIPSSEVGKCLYQGDAVTRLDVS